MPAPRHRIVIVLLLALLAASAARADVAYDLGVLLSKQLCDDVVAQATEQIKRSEWPNPTMMYLRGTAQLRLGRFDAAEADLVPLGNFRPWRNWRTTALDMVAQLAQLRRLCPAQQQLIESNGNILFRVYYDEDNEWTRAVVAALRAAYDKVCEFHGVKVTETVVFIFSEGPRYNAFFRAHNVSPPTDWQWASGGLVLMFCQRDADGKEFPSPDSAYFRSSVFHEFSHCVYRRAFGVSPYLPWLREGLAMLCGALASAGDYARNDARMAQITASGSLLSFDVMVDREQFYAKETHDIAYAQGFAMARLLLSRIGRQGILDLLTLAPKEGSADAAFKAVLGISQRQFYDLWLESVVARRQ